MVELLEYEEVLFYVNKVLDYYEVSGDMYVVYGLNLIKFDCLYEFGKYEEVEVVVLVELVLVEKVGLWEMEFNFYNWFKCICYV